MNKGQPSNRIISRKFVEIIIIVLFCLNIVISLGYLIAGIILSVNVSADSKYAQYFFIASATIFLCVCIFLSFLIVNILKVCELEKINSHLESETPKQNTTELLTYLQKLQKENKISADDYEKEKKNILNKM